MSFIKIRKSENDTLNYRYIILDNGLTVYLVKDKETEFCGASMFVKVGSVHDTIPGIAHFLEHMLFMGNSKYPGESNFMESINQTGGTTNAMTGEHETLYYFTCNHDNYLENLDKFIYFFISPLLNPNSVDKERKAVDSESKKNLNNPSWILLDISKKLFNKNHPVNHYTCGDENTLKGDDLHEKVKDFYNTHYSSDLMSIIVYYNNNIDETYLEQYIKDTFIQIKQIKYNLFKYDPMLLNIPTQLLTYCPKQEQYVLTILFEINKESYNYINNPTIILSSILNNETNGSLYYILSDEQYIVSLNASSGINLVNREIYEISTTLTKYGFINKDKVIRIIFDYLNFLIGKLEYTCDECSINKFIKVVDNSFDSFFKPVYNNVFKSCYRDYNTSVKFDIDNFLLGISGYFIEDIKPEHIVSSILEWKDNGYNILRPKLIDLLKQISKSPKHMLLSQYNDTADDCDDNFTDTEEIYNIKYKIEDYTFSKKIFTCFNCIQENNYICEEINILRKKEKIKSKPFIIPSTNYKLIYSFNSSFSTDLTSIFVYIKTNKLISSCETYVAFSLYLDSILTTLSHELYLLNEAGYNVDVSITCNHNICIYISGYTNCLCETTKNYTKPPTKYVYHIIKQILTQQPTHKTFNTCKDTMRRVLKQFSKQSPYYKLPILVKKEFIDTYYTPYDKFNIIDKLDINKCKTVFYDIFKSTDITIFISGNIFEQDAIKVSKQIYKYINTSPVLTETNVKFIHKKNNYTRICTNSNKHEKNNVFCLIVDIYETSVGNNKLNNKINNSIINYNWNELIMFKTILINIISPKYFAKLRTEKQLGYIVKTFNFNIGSCYTSNGLITLLVQSPKENTIKLYKHTKDFIDTVLTPFIDKLDNKLFKTYIIGIISNLQTPFNNIYSENEYVFDLILSDAKDDNNIPIYDTRPIFINTLKKLTLTKFKEMYIDLFINNGLKYIIGINSNYNTNKSDSSEDKCKNYDSVDDVSE